MKIHNWFRKIGSALVAAGFCLGANAYALNLPLGDPSFEDYKVDSGIGYAYANNYRPTSAWVDDLDSPQTGAPDIEDDAVSNWLYDAAYAEATTFTKRPAPRTGNQAMHGLNRYSAQETSSLFEQGKTYTFSLWAQNDVDLNESHGVYMYIFDGTVQFNDANALVNTLIPEFNTRGVAMTAAQSQANWQKLSISYTVAPGSPAIGHPIGVAFYGLKDSAFDDASLSVVPEPTSLVLVSLAGVSALGVARRRK